MKHHLLLVVLFVAHSEVFAAEVDCSKIIGVWHGQHKFGEMEVFWIVENRADKTMVASFIEKNNSGTEIETKQTGKWGCKGDIMATEVVDDKGNESMFLYKILKIDDHEFIYQNFGKGLGPVFTSKRIHGRT
jgi:hypothetical protein